MSPLQTAALIGLVLYFALLLFVVTRKKKSHNVLDYFFAGRSLPFWALSITFVASWWGAGFLGQPIHRPDPPGGGAVAGRLCGGQPVYPARHRPGQPVHPTGGAAAPPFLLNFPRAGAAVVPARGLFCA